MGEVYSARDTELNRAVAIKFLSPQSLGSSGTVERLIQEARAASALNHPGIVTVHEVIRSEDSLAIVMERVDGMALRSLCGKANAAAEVARLGSQIAEACAGRSRQKIDGEAAPRNNCDATVLRQATIDDTLSRTGGLPLARSTSQKSCAKNSPCRMTNNFR
jgi:hypothetical protein